MPTQPSNILILGATGNIGTYITTALLTTTPPFPSISILTSPSTLQTKAPLITHFQSLNATIILGTITSEPDLTHAFSGIDTIISCVGRALLPHQTTLLRLAENTPSIQWFFPSEFGTDVEHSPSSATEPPHQDKLAVRKFVREEVRRVKVTFLVVGPFFEMWVGGGNFGYKLGGFDVKGGKAWVIGDGEGRVGFCSMGDTGKAVVAALRRIGEVEGRAIKVKSFVTTPNQICREIERQSGRKLVVEYIPLEEVKAFEKQMYEEGNPWAVGPTLRRIWATGGTLYDEWDNERIGLKDEDMETLEGVVKRYLEEQSAS